MESTAPPSNPSAEWMQSLAMFLPTGWAMDAMHKLISFGYAGSTVVPHLTALLSASLLLGILGARTFRFE